MGARFSLHTRLQQKTIRAYVSGCPCHILHNTSSTAAAAFAEVTGFEIEDLAVNVVYWFDKSTNRRSAGKNFVFLQYSLQRSGVACVDTLVKP